jgi:hypothetical protein
VLNCLFINRLTRKNRIGEKTMKTIKAICTATVLALTLSVSAFAGDISSPGALSPSPGEIGTPDTVAAAPSTLLADYDSGGAFEDWVLTLMSML